MERINVNLKISASINPFLKVNLLDSVSKETNKYTIKHRPKHKRENSNSSLGIWYPNKIKRKA